MSHSESIAKALGHANYTKWVILCIIPYEYNSQNINTSKGLGLASPDV